MVALETLTSVTIDGLAFGGLLALLGVGITLVYGMGEVLNLAIGTFAVIAAITAAVLMQSGVGLLPAVLAGVAAAGLLGVVVNQTLLALVYRAEGEERILLGIFTTLGLSVLLRGILVNYFPSRYSISLDLGVVEVADVNLAATSLVTIAVSALVLAALFVFLNRTFLGKATRTVFQDETGAKLVGIDPRRIRSIVFVLSVVVAGIAGILSAMGSNVSITSGFEFTTFALIISIVGGVRSIVGAVVAGVLLGLLNTFANFFIGSYVASIILFAAAVAVILFRPEAISS